MINISSATIISPQVQHTLRNDTTLGSGNFLDRCHALNPSRDIEFVFLETPVRLPNRKEYQSFSLDTFMEARRCLASWYTHLGVDAGDVITICVSDGIMPFLHYLALTSLGAVASIINPAMAPEMAKAYILNNQLKRLIVDNDVIEKTKIVNEISRDPDPLNCEVINYSHANESYLETIPNWWPYQHQDASLVMLSHTSGTTGVSKAVKFEHRQFFMGKRARIGQFAESVDERFLSALPQSHSSAISHLETVVMQGIPTFVMSNTTGLPVRDAINKIRPTIVAGFPQTYASLVQAGIEPNEFASVKRWFSMGDAAHSDHIRRVLIGAPESRFIDSFGSSELGMALFRKISTIDNIAACRCVGRPVEVAVAKVLNVDSGEELAAGETGYLAIRSPTITSGYWNNPEVTARAWCNGYFLTGDVGFCKDGDFYLIDRAADVIASPNGPIYTLMLEEEAQQVDGVCDASVVGVASDTTEKDQVLAVVLLDHGENDNAETLGNQVWQALHKATKSKFGELGDRDITVVVANDSSSIPVGATGKVLKRRLRQDYPNIIATLETDDLAAENFLYLTNGVKTSPRARLTAEG